MNADVWKVDANGKIGAHNGAGTVKLLVPHVDPVILDANYKADNSGEWQFRLDDREKTGDDERMIYQ